MPLRILLADDSPSVRDAVKTLLQREGHDVVAEAADGSEAVELARALRPDVAVLDLGMPGLNGLEAAREILRLDAGTKPILLTVHSEDYHILMALRAGIRGYVVKSHAAEDLVPAILEVSRGGVYLSRSTVRVVVDAYLASVERPGVQ